MPAERWRTREFRLFALRDSSANSTCHNGSQHLTAAVVRNGGAQVLRAVYPQSEELAKRLSVLIRAGAHAVVVTAAFDQQ
jgi:hypothetical protein